MAHKKTIPGMTVIALALSVVLFGCPDPTRDEPDTWSDVTSFSQMNGKWEHTKSESRTLVEMMTGDNSSLGQIEGAESILGLAAMAATLPGMTDMLEEITVTSSYQEVSTYDTAAKKYSASITVITVFSGGKIDTVWTFLEPIFTAMYQEADQTNMEIDPENHSMTYTFNSGDMELPEEGSDITAYIIDGRQINQKRTKLKKPAGTSDNGESYPEEIWIKQ